MNTRQLGIWGEKIAENYLRKKGYEILDRNYSSKFVSGPQRGEIDIIAKKGNTISFIEVKTSSEIPGGRVSASASAFSPEERVDCSKQRKIIRAAESWLIKKKLPLDSKWQVDVVAVKINLDEKKARLSQFKNVG